MKSIKTIFAIIILTNLGVQGIWAQDHTGFMGKKGLVGGGISTLNNLKPGISLQFEYSVAYRQSLALQFDNLSFSNYEVTNMYLANVLKNYETEDKTFSASAFEFLYKIYARRPAPMGVFVYLPLGVARITPTETVFTKDENPPVMFNINNRFSTYYMGFGMGVNRIINDDLMLSFSGGSRFNLQSFKYLYNPSIIDGNVMGYIQNLYKTSAMGYMLLNLDLKVSYLF